MANSTLLSAIGIIASAIGGLFLLIVLHSNTPKHAEAAEERLVNSIAVRVEGVSTEVARNKLVLDEVKEEVREIRVEQRAYTDTILEAIRESN